MKCPNCAQVLKSTQCKGITVDQCENCRGMWFDIQEVDQLEDTVLRLDELKNTMVTNVRPSERKCPKCGENMQKFNYRWEDLELEMCKNKHGYWLDADEEKRVTEIMKQRLKDVERKYKVENEWKRNLQRLQSPSFINKVFDLFK